MELTLQQVLSAKLRIDSRENDDLSVSEESWLVFPGGSCLLEEAWVTRDLWDKLPAKVGDRAGFIPVFGWLGKKEIPGNFLYQDLEITPFQIEEGSEWRLVETSSIEIDMERQEPPEAYNLAARGAGILERYSVPGRVIVIKTNRGEPLAFLQGEDYLYFVGTAISTQGLWAEDTHRFFSRFFEAPCFKLRDLSVDWLSTNWVTSLLNYSDPEGIFPEVKNISDFFDRLGISISLGDYKKGEVKLQDGCWIIRLYKDNEYPGCESVSKIVKSLENPYYGAIVVGSIYSCTIKLLPGKSGKVTGYIDHGCNPTSQDAACHYTAPWSALKYTNLIPIRPLK